MSIVLAACGSSGGGDTASKVAGNWDSILKAANKEGSITVYTSAGNSDVVFKDFEKAHPKIKMTFVRQPTADLLTRLDQEIEVGAKGADVAYHSQTGWFVDRAKQGKLAAIHYGPAANGWPAADKSEKYANILTVPFEAVWNTKKGQAVTDVGDLVDHQAGSAPVGLLDPASSPAAMSQYQAWIDTYGSDFLTKLSKLKTTIYPSTVPLTQAIGSGELTYGLAIPAGIVTPLIDAGAPVGHGIPPKGSVGYNYSAGVLANAPHPNAAMVFMNWLMEKSTLELIVKKLSPGATPVPVPGALDPSTISVYKVSDWPQSRQDKFVADFNKLFPH
jgi:iron(III) transport system substrate-binding protein